MVDVVKGEGVGSVRPLLCITVDCGRVYLQWRHLVAPAALTKVMLPLSGRCDSSRPPCTKINDARRSCSKHGRPTGSRTEPPAMSQVWH